MNSRQVLKKLLADGDKKLHLVLFRENPRLITLKFAEAIKNTYYESWTKEPQKTRRAANALEVLSKLLPDSEVRALHFWVRGIADLTEGKLKKAVKDLEKAAGIFDSLNKFYETAQTQVGKLYALALLGEYDEAVVCGEKARKIFVKSGDELAAGKIEMNLSNVAARRELHREAEKYCLSARRRFTKIGDLNWLTMAENGLANTYAELNDFGKAELFYARALNRAKLLKMEVTEAEIEASIGNLALFRGKLDRALNFLEQSRQKYEALKMPHQTAVAELEIADIYLELNLTDEAFSIYQTIVKQLQMLKMRGEEARARANFGRAAMSRNDLTTARSQLKKAARLYISEKNKVGAAVVKINQANLETSQRNYRKVLKICAEIENLLRDSANLRHRLSVRFIKAEASRNLGENHRAEKDLRLIFADAVKHEQPNTAQAAQISLGKIAVAQNDLRRAEIHFKHAIRSIETVRAPLAAEEFRMSFLANKLAPFELLTKIYLAENKLKKAFLLTEKARARSLADVLDDNLTKERSNAAPTLQKNLAALREELNWFYSRLNRADELEINNLQSEADQREKQIADLMRQIESTNASRTAVQIKTGRQTAVNAPENLEVLQAMLGEQKVLIEFVKFDGKFSAFVVTGKKVHYQDDLAKESDVLDVLKNLQFQFGALRYGTRTLGNFVGELKKRADFYLRKLYEKMFAPLEKYIGERDLVIVPIGAAHYIPFHALFDGANYLIEKREIVHAPSATVWRQIASKPQKKFGKALLIGYADERIPLVNQEIAALNEIFPDAEKFTGEQATSAAFMKNASRFDVLHLACHGQFRPENPLFSSLHLADGRLTVRDISSLKLKAGFVALSACETGLNEIFAGEEILGLARGFLSAGAQSLLLSLWTVSDETTNRLMKMFYERRLRGKSSANALQTAQKHFIERGVHPYLWSPFLLIGK